MVFLGLEKPVEYGAQQIFDPTMANMVLQAQQQYNEAARKEYERGLEDFDKFTTKYGDFISPFAKDMARYGEMVGGIQNVINQAYADGVDLLRSPEGRMLVHKLTNSINPAEFNTMRSNAKMGYAYLDAVQKLRAQGKYSEAQELFDIIQNGGLGFDKDGNKITDFSQFSTAGNDGFNTFNRSPIEAVTLQDLTKSHYSGRTARVLNQQDFNDPRLKGKGYNWDPRYEWSGYLRSDLLKNAPGAILSLAADPRFAFFKEEARQMVMARGEEPTDAAVQRQLEENVADANTWALIDPTRKADDYEKMSVANKYAQSNIYLQHKLAAERAADAHANAMELQMLKNEGKSGGRNTKNGIFQYGDATQDQAIMKLVGSLVGEMEEKDPVTGKMKKVTVQDASRDTVLSAYYKKVLTPYRKYMRNLFNSHIGYKGEDLENSGTHGKHAFEQYLKKFGYIDSADGFEASMGKKVNSDGKVEFTAADIDNVYTDAEVLAMADGYKGFKSGHDHRKEIERILNVRNKNGYVSLDINKLLGMNGSGYVEGMRGTKDMPNKVPVIRPDGSMIMLRAVNIKYGDKNSIHNTGRLWIPTGSPTLPKAYVQTSKGRRIAGLIPYTDEAQSMAQKDENARYSQATGSQKNQNISLSPYAEEEEEIDPIMLYNYLLNNNLE